MGRETAGNREGKVDFPLLSKYMKIETEEKTITPEQIKTLDGLFDPWESASINTDEDLLTLGDVFDEDE